MIRDVFVLTEDMELGAITPEPRPAILSRAMDRLAGALGSGGCEPIQAAHRALRDAATLLRAQGYWKGREDMLREVMALLHDADRAMAQARFRQAGRSFDAAA